MDKKFLNFGYTVEKNISFEFLADRYTTQNPNFSHFFYLINFIHVLFKLQGIILKKIFLFARTIIYNSKIISGSTCFVVITSSA